MDVVAVIDVMEGVVVRGVAGRRHEYKPIQSVLTQSCEPIAVARDLRDRLGIEAIYVADLDVILGRPFSPALYEGLAELGLTIWADAGLRNGADAARIAGVPIDVIVAGLETLQSPNELERIVAAFGNERVVFSVDLKAGRPIGHVDAWPGSDAEGIVLAARACGVDRFLFLDLSRVGTDQGVGTDELIVWTRSQFPKAFIACGGGVRGMSDFRRLESIGADAVLVASALHDGRITAEHIASLKR